MGVEDNASGDNVAIESAMSNHDASGSNTFLVSELQQVIGHCTTAVQCSYSFVCPVEPSRAEPFAGGGAGCGSGGGKLGGPGSVSESEPEPTFHDLPIQCSELRVCESASIVSCSSEEYSSSSEGSEEEEGVEEEEVSEVTLRIFYDAVHTF